MQNIMQDTAMQVFTNEQFGNVRTLTIDGETRFVGKDVAIALRYERPTKAVVDHVEEEDRIMIDRKTQSQFGIELGQRGGWLINESGLYSLIMSSKLESAKQFKRWVTSEVLPAIRKHGAYMTPETIEAVLMNPDTIIRLATDLKAERERNQALQTQMETDKPKVIFAEAVNVAQTSILIGELAKLLKQNGVETGQNRLFQWLRDNGYLISRQGTDYNMPTQKSMELGLFTIRETAITHPDGHVSIGKTPKVTGKGQLYFTEKFLRGKEQ